ncbi:MAG TPA: hypothetical protein VEZ71_31430, partial [Archangium sp.]|nr:hypothetical protein [Archangium sp.]
RREAEHVWCARCSELKRHNFLVRHADEQASRERLKVHQKTEDPRVLALGALKAAAERLKAAIHCLEAVDYLSPAEQRHYILCAEGRAKWSASLVEGVLPHLAEAREAAAHGLSMVPSSLGEADVLDIPTAPPTLRLVRPEDANEG